jgi:hypothetical protein
MSSSSDRSARIAADLRALRLADMSGADLGRVFDSVAVLVGGAGDVFARSAREWSRLAAESRAEVAAGSSVPADLPALQSVADVAERFAARAAARAAGCAALGQRLRRMAEDLAAVSSFAGAADGGAADVAEASRESCTSPHRRDRMAAARLCGCSSCVAERATAERLAAGSAAAVVRLSRAESGRLVRERPADGQG